MGGKDAATSSHWSRRCYRRHRRRGGTILPLPPELLLFPGGSSGEEGRRRRRRRVASPTPSSRPVVVPALDGFVTQPTPTTSPRAPLPLPPTPTMLSAADEELAPPPPPLGSCSSPFTIPTIQCSSFDILSKVPNRRSALVMTFSNSESAQAFHSGPPGVSPLTATPPPTLQDNPFPPNASARCVRRRNSLSSRPNSNRRGSSREL